MLSKKINLVTGIADPKFETLQSDKILRLD